MELYQAMKERRSIRKYKPDLPGRDTIPKIPDAANWAPFGMNEQHETPAPVPGVDQTLEKKVTWIGF